MIFDCHSILTVNEHLEHNCLVTYQHILLNRIQVWFEFHGHVEQALITRGCNYYSNKVFTKTISSVPNKKYPLMVTCVPGNKQSKQSASSGA